MAANTPVAPKADEPKVLDSGAEQKRLDDEEKAVAERQVAAKKKSADRVTAARKAADKPVLSAIARAKELADTARDHRDLPALAQAFHMLADGLYREHGGMERRLYDVRYRNDADRVVTATVAVATPDGMSEEEDAQYTDDYISEEMRDRHGAPEGTHFERRVHEDAPWA